MPRTRLQFALAAGIEVTGVEVDGTQAPFARAASPPTSGRLASWTVNLPVPLASGAPRDVIIRASIAEKGVRGIRIGPDGGALLPGSAWIPRLEPEVSARVAGSVSFDLPAGWQGIGAGSEAAPGGPWATREPGRPFAVWGAFVRQTVEGTPDIVAFRRPGRDGPVPRAARIRAILTGLELGVGAPIGGNAWTLIDCGESVPRGGPRAVFWDEGDAAARLGIPDEATDRDLATALAASYWTEWMTFHGDQAAWLDEGFCGFLGDAAVIALDPNENRLPVESRLIGSRRKAFLRNLDGDRALQGIDALDPASAPVLASRGPLLVHQISQLAPSGSKWMLLLRGFRTEHDHTRVEWPELQSALEKPFPRQLGFVDGFLTGTHLPDFRISDHGPSEGRHPDRYRVEVENVGDQEAAVDIAVYTPGGQFLREYRSHVPAGEKRAVNFRDASRIGRIELDPRGIVPQPSLDGEIVTVGSPAGAPVEEAPIVPTFPLSTRADDCAKVSSFAVEVAPGVRVQEFDGYVQWYGTYHGPGAAALLGRGLVVLEPVEPHSQAFHDDTGQSMMSFDGQEIWIRFPVDKWNEIEPLLGERVDSREQELSRRSRDIHTNGFPAFFFEDGKAQLVPEGGGLVCFSLGGNERRAITRVPNPDGTVTMRLWDHIRGNTIWEATR